MLKNTRSHSITVLAAAVVVCSVAFSSGHFENPDAHLRLTQAFSIANGSGFQIPDDVGNPDHGNIAFSDAGKKYSVYGPGQIILFSPFALLARTVSDPAGLHPHYVAEIITSALGVAMHFLTGVLIFFAAKSVGRDRDEAITLSLLFAFCTVNLPSSRDGYEHTYEALFLLISYLMAWKANAKSQPARYMLIAGIALGMGALFRPNILLALPGLIFIARRPVSIAWLLLGVVPSILTLFGYNIWRFENPLMTGYTAAWSTANPELHQSFNFSLDQIVPALYGLLLSPGKGLFLFTPILLLLVFCGISKRTQRACVLVPIVSTSLAYMLFYSANFAWHGSAWSWGPRYIIALVPLLILLLPVKEIQDFRRTVLPLLASISVTIQSAAIVSNYKRHLTKLWKDHPEVFSNGDIFFDPSLSPLLGIFVSASNTLSKLFSNTTLFTYLDPDGWHSEARPASLDMMLSASIDLNSVDLWWIRIMHFPLPNSYQIAAFALGAICLVSVPYLIRKLMVLAR